jgi:hypothetical protein
MIRQAAAVVVALCLSTSPLYAQSTTVKLTVSDASANVHKTPSMGSPVIGKAPRGTELVVTREVGDWVKVSWPSSADGAGYVRMTALAWPGTQATAGSKAPATAKAAPAGAKAATTAKAAPAGSKTAATAKPAPAGSKTAATAKAAPAPATALEPVGSKAAVTPTATPAPAATGSQVQTRPAPPPSALYVAPTHVFGVGAMAGGSTMGLGVSARRWSPRGRLGFQLEVSRYSYDSLDMLSRASSTDIAPSVLFAFNDRVTDTLWLRPYLGLGGHLVHSSRTDLIFTDQTESANTFGGRAFFGAEMAFSSLPKFAVSTDVGYYHMPEPFVGFEPGGLGFSISAHWYVK